MKGNWLFLVCLSSVVAAQPNGVCEKELYEIITKRNNYVDMEYTDVINTYDSVAKYNEQFETLLLQCTKTAGNLKQPFVSLEEQHVNLSSSPDNRFRIYCWDDETGGTMRFAKSIFQFGDGGKVYSQIPDWDTGDEGDDEDYNGPGYFYSVVDEVVSEGKKYYVVKCISIGSSAASLHKIKIFSIDNGKLNGKAALIRTKTGIRNELAYEIDLSSSVNRGPDVEREWTKIQYDAKSKTIAIPLIQEDGKVTPKKIRYQFNGTYFVKL